jgi:hypothetical protein
MVESFGCWGNGKGLAKTLPLKNPRKELIQGFARESVDRLLEKGEQRGHISFGGGQKIFQGGLALLSRAQPVNGELQLSLIASDDALYLYQIPLSNPLSDPFQVFPHHRREFTSLICHEEG